MPPKYSAFTLSDTEIQTDKMQIIWIQNAVGISGGRRLSLCFVNISTQFCTSHFIGICISLGVGQCEHTIGYDLTDDQLNLTINT